MNKLLVIRLLGIIVLLIGGAMLLSLPWVFPICGEVDQFDWRSANGLLGAMAVCAVVGLTMVYAGRSAQHQTLFRKEAMAVVGLSWVLATILGALPFWLSGTASGRDAEGQRIPITIADGLFESASGFSGTGASILPDLEDPELVPRAILFWRSETHFLGGLGIMVLFVAILGFGSAGKALMLTEMPGPTKETTHTTSRKTAGIFASIFLGLTLILSILLMIEGMTIFDAVCHAFAAIATGGFSNYNSSVGHFNSPWIDYTLVLFMAIACTNFTLLYYAVLMQPSKLARDVEFRVYLTIMGTATIGVIGFGLYSHNFDNFADAMRYGSFQVVSIMTNTGFSTANFDQWCGFNRATLLVLMFIGGCAGSTSCSIKVIRHIILFKELGIELEKSFRPRIVRSLRVGDQTFDSLTIVRDVLVYFCMFAVVAFVGWFVLVIVEPDTTWVHSQFHHQKLIDCASAVAATINGVGPGLGIVGATHNYHVLHPISKLTLSGLMLLGRLELFVLLALFQPKFWRSQ